MEFIAELILELIFEVIINPKVSKWIRIPLAFVVIIFYLLLLFMFIYIGVESIKEKNYLVSIIMILVACLIIWFLINLIKKIKNKV